MTKEKRFKKEYGIELLRIAEGDLHSAKVLEKDSIGRRENILFHAEQCIEKCLKAVLCHLERPLPLVHDLDVILDRFLNGPKIPRAADMGDLSQFAAIRRYEEGKSNLEPEEIQAVLQMAEETLQWAKKIIQV